MHDCRHFHRNGLILQGPKRTPQKNLDGGYFDSKASTFTALHWLFSGRSPSDDPRYFFGFGPAVGHDDWAAYRTLIEALMAVDSRKRLARAFIYQTFDGLMIPLFLFSSSKTHRFETNFFVLILTLIVH